LPHPGLWSQRLAEQVTKLSQLPVARLNEQLAALNALPMERIAERLNEVGAIPNERFLGRIDELAATSTVRISERLKELGELSTQRLAEQLASIGDVAAVRISARLSQQMEEVGRLTASQTQALMADLANLGESVSARWIDQQQLLDLGNLIVESSIEDQESFDEPGGLSWDASDTQVMWWSFVFSIALIISTMKESTDTFTRESVTKLVGFLGIVALINTFRPRSK
jgi:hypothetical protein